MNIVYVKFVWGMVFLLLSVSAGFASGFLFANDYVVWPIVLAITSLISTIVFAGIVLNQREEAQVREKAKAEEVEAFLKSR